MAGKIDYIAPIENASGKIFGLKTRFCSVKRQSGDRKKGCAFMGQRDTVNHPVSQHELDIRANFTSLTKVVAQRLKKDNPRFEADHNLYRESKFDSFKKWLWAQVKANPVGIDYLIYGGKNYYPGGETLNLSVASNNQLSLALVPGTGEKLVGSLQVKVNGTALTNVNVENDTLTATLPASLDARDVMTVTLVTDDAVYKLQYA